MHEPSWEGWLGKKGVVVDQTPNTTSLFAEVWHCGDAAGLSWWGEKEVKVGAEFQICMKLIRLSFARRLAGTAKGGGWKKWGAKVQYKQNLQKSSPAKKRRRASRWTFWHCSSIRQVWQPWLGRILITWAHVRCSADGRRTSSFRDWFRTDCVTRASPV